MCSVESKPLFRDLNADDADPEVTVVESMCMNCHANGTTRLLLTRIPHYKNVVLMSFSCEECGFQNNEIQPGGAHAEMGVRYELKVETPEDLNRQIVKSDYTSVRIPELDFEIPAQSQRGEVTTVEGMLSRAAAGLASQQTERRRAEPAAAAALDDFLARLKALIDGGQFTVVLEDISGNCHVENPCVPRADARCARAVFPRSPAQDRALGIYTDEERGAEPAAAGTLQPSAGAGTTYDDMSRDDVVSFPTNCPECNAPAQTNMKLTKIPYFKEVVIMATNCDACGHRTNEVKSGGGIEPKGVRFEVRLETKEDFCRDVLKSETCGMSVPALQMEAGARALGGRFTTAEGLLRAARDQITCSAVDAHTRSMDKFLERLDAVLAGNEPVTIVLDDPAGNSYVQSLADDPAQPDDGLKITHYERSYEQNDELGLNDMKTEGYEAS